MCRLLETIAKEKRWDLSDPITWKGMKRKDFRGYKVCENALFDNAISLFCLIPRRTVLLHISNQKIGGKTCCASFTQI